MLRNLDSTGAEAKVFKSTRARGDRTTSVRDFIYLDVERLKSALSQMDKGLLETVSKAGSRTKQLGAGAGGGLAAIVGLSGKADFLWTNEQTETRTLHDHIYNLVEDALRTYPCRSPAIHVEVLIG
jgi:hypothetical protein